MPEFYGMVKNNEWYGSDENDYSKKYKIIYDGEIYNSMELKMELIDKGYIFFTYLEEEVVLKAFIEWGTNCFYKFSGVFFIAIWNMENKTLFIARDFVGGKPIYYALREDGIVFANSISKLFALTNVKATSNYDKIFNLFVFDNVNNQENTVFNGINLLMPGHYLIFDGNIKQINYRNENNYETSNLRQDIVSNVRDIVIESIIKYTLPDIDVFTELFGSNFNIIIISLLSDILKFHNKSLMALEMEKSDNILKLVESFNVDHTLASEEFEIEDIYKILAVKEFPDVHNFLPYYNSLRKMKDKLKICITGAYSEYLFINTNEFLYNQRIDILNEEFIKNINKDYLIKEFFAKKYEKNYKYDYVISRVLESREKIASFFNISTRNPIYSKELIEYLNKIEQNKIELNLLYEAFESFANVKEYYLPRSIPKEKYILYSKMIDIEFIHILENPTSKVLEVIDREKAVRVCNVKLKKFIIEFNYWLKLFNVDIL